MGQGARRKGRSARPGGGQAWTVGAVVGLVAVLVVAGFLLLRGGSGNTAAPPETAAPGRAPAGQAALPLAPDIDVTMYQGQAVAGGSRVALSQLWQGKPVVLNFWAGFCPPCRAEMPDFQRFYEARKDKFILIGVDIGPFIGLGSREDGKALLQELRITYPAGTTFDARTVRNYQILGMPTTVFITPQGRILRKYTGLMTREQMDGFLNELLKASGSL